MKFRSALAASLILAFGLTEPEAGSNPRQMTTQFDKKGDITGKTPYFFIVRGGKFEAYR